MVNKKGIRIIVLIFGLLLLISIFLSKQLLFIMLGCTISVLPMIIIIYSAISASKYSIKGKKNVNNNSVLYEKNKIDPEELKCPKCNNLVNSNETKCSNCGENLYMNINSFGEFYSVDESKLLEKFIDNKITQLNGGKKIKKYPKEVLKRKRIFKLIFSILLFVYICLIFFHFPNFTYILGFIILLVLFIKSIKFNTSKYLKKDIIARPSEKMSNIIVNANENLVEDNSKFVYLVGIVIAITLPLIIFMNPRIMYEKVDGGYGVRFYSFGLTNNKTAVIPETYKNEKVVSLRGNTFSNMKHLEKVTLPNTITEIRGQAFKNCYSLREVNIPSNLEYLGGGAFYNAKSIRKITLPDTLTYLGGEAFYGASNLESITLSNNLTEIRGNTFENCSSLESIVIPDKVKRIGGHAFYGNTHLSKVEISENSKLEEIGSSAFRQCKRLYSITIPNNTYVNERAFKESPTEVKKRNNNNMDYYGIR